MTLAIQISGVLLWAAVLTVIVAFVWGVVRDVFDDWRGGPFTTERSDLAGEWSCGEVFATKWGAVRYASRRMRDPWARAWRVVNKDGRVVWLARREV